MAHVTSRDGTRIAFEQNGQGPAVILVDGALCSRAAGPMPALATLLAAHHTVYAYDRRGRNESGDTKPYAVDREVEDLAALIDAAGGSACVYGASSGAALAFLAASKLGPKVRKVAGYEAPYNGDPAARQRLNDYAKDLTEALAADRRGDAVELFMRLVGTPADQVAGMRQSPYWSALEAVAPTLAYDAAILGDGALPLEQAASIAAPALLLNGGASPAFMGASADALANVMPRAERRVLADQRHDAAAEALAPILAEFFGS